jgi:ribosomal subunit interface protein
MDLIFKTRNGSRVSDRQRTHIEQKLGKLERYLDQINSATVEVVTEQRHDEGEVQRLQVTLVGEHGIILRADQRAADIYAATDLVQNVLQRQIKRYKEKHWRRGRLRHRAGEFIASEPPVVADEPEELDAESQPDRQVVRVKNFELLPMYSDEAIEQMELLDHSFFVYRDADTAQISIVYRRHDGNYGLIMPESTY